MEQHRYGIMIKQLSRAFEKVINSFYAQMDLTFAQGMTLRYLSAHQDRPVYARDLEHHFALSHPTVSGILQRLEAKGFITFAPEKQDRRCKRIVLTPRYLDNHEQICTTLGQLEQTLVGGFSEDEKEQFWALLCRAAQNVEDFSSQTETEESE